MVCVFDMFCANEITIYKVNANDIIRPFVEGEVFVRKTMILTIFFGASISLKTISEFVFGF